VHILPFFPYSSDDGFSVIDYRRVNPEFGEWRHVQALAERFSLMFDLVLNHCSAKSAWFQDYTNGILPARFYFIEMDPETDLSEVVRPRTSPLLTPTQTRDGERHVWTTFSADQVDLDFSNPDVLFEFLDILFLYISMGMRVIRLDAIAYLWKRPGTSCIHLPETHAVVKLLRDVLELVAPEVLLLTETNVPHEENISYFGEGDEANVVYNFSLPPLLLHAYYTGSAATLADWATSLGDHGPGCTFLNFTASHDGVGVRPLEGLVPDEEREMVFRKVRERGGHLSSKSNADGTESVYEMNITYYDAFRDPEQASPDGQIRRFLGSQTIALALKGIPAFYFHSLTATKNWNAGVQETGRARTINRMKWDEAALEGLLEDPASETATVFSLLSDRIRIRRRHAAFHPDGPQTVLRADERVFAIERAAPDGGETVVALHNISGDAVEIPLASLRSLHGGAGRVVDLLDGEAPLAADAVRLEPWACAWLTLRPQEEQPPAAAEESATPEEAGYEPPKDVPPTEQRMDQGERD
jgi:sucrose phosphorylase